jgi:error-prone DNA polymerase
VFRVDIHRSRGRCTLEGNAIRLGLRYVHGFGEQAIASVEAAQQGGRFTSLEDFCRRTRLARRLVENLILVGAMDSWHVPRRTLLWQLGALDYQENGFDWRIPIEEVEFPAFSALDETLLNYDILGLAPDGQIMTHYRARLSERGLLSSTEVLHARDGQRVSTAGLCVTAQRPPTAKGFCFVTLEDEEGLVNVIIRPAIYERTKSVWLYSPLIAVSGVVQHTQGITNLVAQTAWPLSHS